MRLYHRYLGFEPVVFFYFFVSRTKSHRPKLIPIHQHAALVAVRRMRRVTISTGMPIFTGWLPGR